MPINTAAAINDMQAILERYRAAANELSPFGLGLSNESEAEFYTLLKGAILHYAPPGRHYHPLLPAPYEPKAIPTMAGVLAALQSDYVAGRLQTFTEHVRSEMFSDFLEMAEYLLDDEKLKDAAAVLAGGVLEEHLRKLCTKHRVCVSPRPTIDAMNTDLAKNRVYGKNEQKQITAWAGLRNAAAHANYGAYDGEHVRLLIKGVRHFITTNPA